MLRTLQYSLEYFLASRSLGWVENHTAEQCARKAEQLAHLWFKLDAGRRHLCISNILQSGITSDRNEAEDIARRSVEHFALVIVESLKSRDVLNADNWKEKIDLQIPDATMDLLTKKGAGVLLLSGHIGNWEVAARLLSFLKPVTGITRDMKNPRVDELIKKHKPSDQFRLTPKHDADPSRLLSVLKNGEVLALLIDQYAMSYGINLPFFGRTTSVHKSPALLHLVTKTPIVFGACLRTAPMQFRFEASEPLSFTPTGKRDADISTVLTDLIGRMEKLIKHYPEQYLWAHRRWR